LSRRHGRLPGSAPGADCLILRQIRPCDRPRRPHPHYVEMATRNAIYDRPGVTYLDMPDDIVQGKCDEQKVVQVERAPDSAAHRGTNTSKRV
jgi:thiamine pyrophosphate-dependent acetolactate synthase large subunit-like protein